MNQFSKKVITTYKINQLYKLTLDIDEYPSFIPWCDDLRILKQSKNLVEAEVLIKAFGICKKYTCKIKISPPKKGTASIIITSNSGPFKFLESKWLFTKIDNSHSELNFYINFQLQSNILDLMVRHILPKVCKEIIKAFDLRAKELFHN